MQYCTKLFYDICFITRLRNLRIPEYALLSLLRGGGALEDTMHVLPETQDATGKPNFF